MSTKEQRPAISFMALVTIVGSTAGPGPVNSDVV